MQAVYPAVDHKDMATRSCKVPSLYRHSTAVNRFRAFLIPCSHMHHAGIHTSVKHQSTTSDEMTGMSHKFMQVLMMGQQWVVLIKETGLLLTSSYKRSSTWDQDIRKYGMTINDPWSTRQPQSMFRKGRRVNEVQVNGESNAVMG